MTREEAAERAARPDADLPALARAAGLAHSEVRRLGAAWAAQGEAGVAALIRRPALAPLLGAFFRARIQAWLDRELSPATLAVEGSGARFTLLREGRPLLQLRLLPHRCRWLLLARRERSWWPHVPSRPCLSLVDWLGQIRRLVTSPSPPSRRFDTPRGL